jgi:hypothetical protein
MFIFITHASDENSNTTNERVSQDLKCEEIDNFFLLVLSAFPSSRLPPRVIPSMLASCLCEDLEYTSMKRLFVFI